MADTAAPLALARHYVDVDQPGRALEMLGRVGGDELEQPEFWSLSAVAHYELDDYERAAGAAQEGLARDPESVRLLYLLAMAEAERGRLAEAERAALGALELDPDDPALLCAYARVVARGGQLDKADRLVDEAAAIDPEEPDITRMRAFLAFLRGRDREAAGYADELLNVDPESPSAHRLRGAALLRQGDVRGARRSFEAVAGDDPTDHELADVTRAARAATHPLLWPMLPLQRLGVAGSWVAAMAVIFGLRGAGLETAAGIAALVWFLLVIYSWTVAPLVLKRLTSRGP